MIKFTLFAFFAAVVCTGKAADIGKPQSFLRERKTTGSSSSNAGTQVFEYQNFSFKNVIVLVPDGCDEAIQTLSRWYRGEDLKLDKLSSTAVKIHMANSVITGSAAAATAFATAKKTTVRFLGVGPRTEDLLSIYEPSDMAPPYAPIGTILEAAKLKGKSTGLVATSRISHATPAAFACHIDDRGKDNDIIEHMVYNNVDVVFGGGRRHLLPGEDCPNSVEGGYREDCQNLEEVLKDRGYQMVETRDQMMDLDSGKVWGLFEMSHMSPDVDRSHFTPWEPSIAEMTEKAIELLSKNNKGFFLVVEGSQVDWAGHANDPFYMLTDFIAFDWAVKKAVDFAQADGNTLVLVFPDHNTGGMKIGNYLHGYTDVSVEALRDPFLNMKMTSEGVVKMMPEEPTTQDLIDAIKQYWGLDITAEDADDIFAYKEESGEDLSYAISRLVSERYTYIGWTTHGHNGETVPLWMYGARAPGKVIENTDLALMVADAFNLDLDDTTEKLFVDLDTTGLTYEVNLNDSTNPIVDMGVAVFPIGKDYVEINGKKKMLPGVTVYAPMTGKVYVSKKALELVEAEL